jgi:hypothetical protein
MAETVIGAKRMALSDESAEKIADFIALKSASGTQFNIQSEEVEV